MELINIFAKLEFVENRDIQDYNKPLKRDLEDITMIENAPSPNNPPWNSSVAFGFWFVSVILILTIPFIPIVPYILSQNINLSDKDKIKELLANDPTSVVIGLGGTLIAHILTLILGWLIVTRINRYPFFKILGWKWGGFKIWHAISLLIGVFLFVSILNNFLGSADNEMLKILRSSRNAVYAVAFLATFTAPLVEELVYRGVLYSAFQRTFSESIAIIFVTTVFASVHFFQYYPDYTTLISITLLSFILTVIRAKTGNLLPCFVFHTLINGIQAIVLVFAPYLPETLDASKTVNGFFLLK